MLHTRLIEELKEAKKDVENLLIHNGANNYEEYRYFMGRITGFNDAITICQEIFKRSIDE